MPGWTNRGKYDILNVMFRAASVPGNGFAVFLATNATAPSPDTNVKSDLTEIAVGNGYSAGGITLARNSTDFDVLTEDDTNDRALIQIRDLQWTASGGPIPASGSGARWAILTDQNSTMSSRDVIAYWNLGSDTTVSNGQTLTLQNCELRLLE